MWRKFRVACAASAALGCIVLTVYIVSESTRYPATEERVRSQENEKPADADWSEDDGRVRSDRRAHQLFPGEVLGSPRFGQFQILEGPSELWMFVEVLEYAIRTYPSSPPTRSYPVSILVLRLFTDGTFMRYELAPVVTVHPNLATVFRHEDDFYLWEDASMDRPLRIHRWREDRFAMLPPREQAALRRQLKLDGRSPVDITDRLAEITRKSDFAVLSATARMSAQGEFRSERLQFIVRIETVQEQKRIVAESLSETALRTELFVLPASTSD